MPKKYKQTYSASVKNSTYVHPSLSSNKFEPLPPSAQAPPTVNECIQQLRREQASQEATRRHVELTSASVLPSVPPELRSILGVPEAAPPAPKPGTRQRLRLRTPGPAPPPSWLTGSSSSSRAGSGSRGRFGASAARTARTFGRGNAQDYVRPRPARLAAFASSVGERTVREGSLVHTVLRRLAENWDTLDDDGVEYLSNCPPYIIAALPAYLASYGPNHAPTVEALDMLLHAGGPDASLDLTALAGWSIAVGELSRFVARRQRQSSDSGRISRLATVSEAWDDDDDEVSIHTRGLALYTAPVQRSLVITKLSLAMPPSSVSWTDLLDLTSHLPKLTHLSLAAWPVPTRSAHPSTTPTSFTSSMSLATYRMINDVDHLDESQSILRQLSKQTYCLEYLDLSGCPWVPSTLVPPSTILPPPSTTATSTSRFSDATHWQDLSSPSITHADWSGAWSLLTHLDMAQSTPPTALPHVPRHTLSQPSPAGQTSGAASVRRDLATYLHRLQSTAPVGAVASEWRSLAYRTKSCAACRHVLGSWEGCAGCVAWAEHCARTLDAWVEMEAGLRETAARVKRVRKGCRVDLGWSDV